MDKSLDCDHVFIPRSGISTLSSKPHRTDHLLLICFLINPNASQSLQLYNLSTLI